MRRILALIWLSLSLAIASAPAFAVPSPDCPKAHSSSMADMPDGHDGMTDPQDGADCCAENCARDCAAVCPGTVMPPEPAAVDPVAERLEQRSPRPSSRLESALVAATDPPPRTIFS